MLDATTRTSGPRDAIAAMQMSTLANTLCEQSGSSTGKLARVLAETDDTPRGAR